MVKEHNLVYLCMLTAINNYPGKTDQFIFYLEFQANRTFNWFYKVYKKIENVVNRQKVATLSAFILLLIVAPILFVLLTLSICIGLPIATFLYWYLARKMSKNRADAIQMIQTASFESVKNLELLAVQFLLKSEPLEKDINKLKNIIILKPLVKHYTTILESFKELKKECIKRYTYSQEDTGLNDMEFDEYKAAFKSFSDIWDYPSSKKEQELVFNHKKANS